MGYPALVYRCPGASVRPGGTYSYLGVNSDDEAKAAIDAGWFATLPEAIEAHDNPPVDPLPVAELAPVDDNAPIDRAELETMAKDLNIKFDWRTGYKRLRTMIEEATK